jgi:alkylation response protein AidB-like acyl-CoA dehydrogenase
MATTRGRPHPPPAVTCSKVGWLSSDTRELSSDDCRVLEAHLLAEVGRGYAQFLRTLDGARIAIAALSVQLARVYRRESRYMDEREAFGHTISEYQVPPFKLADMDARALHTRSGHGPT